MYEQLMLFVVSVFKGVTLNKKIRLDHESLIHPETHILRYHGYMLKNRDLKYTALEKLWLK